MNGNTLASKLAGVSLIGIVASIATPALAQVAPSADVPAAASRATQEAPAAEEQGNDIVVTARFRQESLLNESDQRRDRALSVR